MGEKSQRGLTPVVLLALRSSSGSLRASLVQSGAGRAEACATEVGKPEALALAGVAGRWTVRKARPTRTMITETGSQGFRLKRVRSSLGLRRMARTVVRPARRVGTSAAPALTKMGTT